MTEQHLRKHLPADPGHIIWPRATTDIPDDTMILRVAFLPPDVADCNRSVLVRRLDQLHRFWGQTRRQFRNALIFALPDQGAVSKSEQALVSELYNQLAIPLKGSGHGGSSEFEFVPLPVPELGRDTLDGLIGEALKSYLRTELAPSEIIRITGLGQKDCAGIMREVFPVADIARWIFSFLTLPRLRDVEPIQKSIARGVAEGLFGFVRTNHLLELDRFPLELKAEVQMKVALDPAGIDFNGNAYLILPDAVN